MLRVLALKCFAGIISMYEGEVREMPDGPELRELVACGYVKVLDTEKKPGSDISEAKPIKPKGGKKNDTKPAKRK